MWLQGTLLVPGPSPWGPLGCDVRDVCCGEWKARGFGVSDTLQFPNRHSSRAGSE